MIRQIRRMIRQIWRTARGQQGLTDRDRRRRPTKLWTLKPRRLRPRVSTVGGRFTEADALDEEVTSSRIVRHGIAMHPAAPVDGVIAVVGLANVVEVSGYVERKLVVAIDIDHGSLG
jgi:hypothetical protein